jgi:hypothetical protein
LRGCYFLDRDNHIKDATDLEADALAAATHQALALLRERPEHHAIEIWQGDKQLHASGRDDS